MGGDRRQFPACDGLRAVAAGSVLLFHATVLTGLAARSSLGPYFRQLDVGVDVFFVLSGFLLYRPFVRAHLNGGDDPPVGRYLRRRFLRIFPAYWLALAAVIYLFHQATVHTGGDGAVFFGLVQIYSGRHTLGGLVPAWSLCTEISFYVFLPLYALVLRRVGHAGDRLRLELVGVVTLYAVSLAFKIITSSRGFHLADTWLPSYLDVFALGMLLAVVSVAAERTPAPRWWQAIPADAAVWWTGAAALFVAVSNLGMPAGLAAPSVGKYLLHHLLAGTIGVLLVSPAVLHERAGGRIRGLLESSVARWLGVVSYGIFLWHLPWIVQATKWTGGQPYIASFWPVLALSLLLTLTTAWVTYTLVERPLLGRGRRGTPAVLPAPNAPSAQPR